MNGNKQKDFLCSISDNKFDVEFIAFNIRDYNTKEVLFDADTVGSKNDNVVNTGSLELDIDFNSPVTENSYRKIKYTFSERVLRLPLIATS